ncbi:hypothetical protein [Cellulosimicrobium arenosum]|uniref:Uncharacterized protein n=1 Tax=Cellulosimicrobium arenosum TaxID=2708133 RepID=A0A927G716_9MICO|nr:hypothetical protein [Cellulosimicrobium arenosum]MBD8078059.1 hypothetical protein [Cellulosimicrobium arenosum]
MNHEDASHGPAPLGSVDPAPMHDAVEALAASLHEYVEAAVGVRAEFGAAEADEDPRILALEQRVGSFNAHLFDRLHEALGMHPDLTSSVWEPGADDADAASASVATRDDLAEEFYLGFVVAPPAGTADMGLDDVVGLLDDAGARVVERLVDSGFDVVEWTASRGDAFDETSDGVDDPDDDGPADPGTEDRR